MGDVNERIAGTSHEDAADRPGLSNIDVLALFDPRVYAAYGNDPYTRIHHLMTLTRARFADSGTNIRLRTVGMRQTEWNEGGLSDELDTLMAGAWRGPGAPASTRSSGPGIGLPLPSRRAAHPSAARRTAACGAPVWAAVDTVVGRRRRGP